MFDSEDRPLGDVIVVADSIYRIAVRGPEFQSLVREASTIEELRAHLQSLLFGAEPERLEQGPRAVTVWGSIEGEHFSLTVQNLVAQPTSGADAPIGSGRLDWAHAVLEEAWRCGWRRPR